MTDLFLCGPLARPELYEILFGRSFDTLPASLPGHVILALATAPFARLTACDSITPPARGVLIRGLKQADLDRLAFLAGLPGHSFHSDTDADADKWQPDDWARHWLAITQATLVDAMALYGSKPAAEVQRRWPQMMLRAASRLRAAATGPTTLRRQADASDLQIRSRRLPYAHFFAVEEYDLAYRRFNGALSAVTTRAAFISCDAVTVLPYDPRRDRVLVVEQFRAGPYARGDSQPWQIEAIAGRIDAEEGAEQAARREAVEEAGLELGALLPVAQYYPTPGAKSEFIYSYVGICDLDDTAGGIFGLEAETEDIRAHLLPFERLIALVASGEIANAPLILTVFWLQRERARLRAEAGDMQSADR
jgi:ADP-ribose pyrophosphatase